LAEQSYKSINNIKLLNKRPQQSKFIFDIDSEFCHMVGGNRCGKTYGGAEKAILLTYINSQRSKTEGLAIEPTLDMAYHLLKPKIEMIAERLKFKYVWKEQKHMFVFPKLRDSQILLRSAEVPQRIEGGQYSWIWIDEPAQCKPEIWKRIITRLNDKRAVAKQIFTTGTPEGLNWYFKEITKLDQLTGLPIHRIIKGSVEEILLNAGEDHILRLEQNLDPLLLQEKLYGDFLNTTQGAIFYAFDEQCIIPTYKPDFNLPLIVSCDFNINPCIWNLHQVIGRGVFSFDELVMYNANTEAMCDKLRAWLIDKPFSAITFYGDYTSFYQRTTSSSITDWMIIDNNFRSYPNYKKKLKINPLVKARVQTQNGLFAHGQHKITPNCKYLIDDFRYVVWSKNGCDLDKSDPDRTHACDGTGYFVNYEFGLGKKYSRIF
jgi:hypothetical protein